MPSQLRLHPTAAAAAQTLAAEEGGALLAGDSARGFFAYALELARKVRPFRLPEPIEQLALARAAAARAKLALPVAAVPAFARTLSELHGTGLQTPQLQRLGAADLARALEAHRQLLAERGLEDPAAVPWLAAEAAAAESFAEAIEVLPRLHWTQGELAWMAALGKRSRVTVRLPEDPDRPELFLPLNPVHQELARVGSVRLAGDRATVSNAITAHSFGSVNDEARAVATAVREALRSGVAPDSLAVTSLGTPAPQLFSALEAAGVPVGSRPAALSELLAGQAPLLLLATADEGIPRERICELLEGRLLDIRDSLRWARHLREAGSASHSTGRLLPPLEAFLRRKPALSREGLAELEAAIAVIAGLPARTTVEEHARALWRALAQLGIVRRLARPLVQKSAAPVRQLRLFEPVLAEARTFEAPWVEVAQAEGLIALEQLQGALDSMAGLAIGGGALTLAEFARLLGAALSRTNLRRVPALAGGVTVARAEELAGRTFSQVFLTGLSGTGVPSEDAFLPEQLRRAACELCERPALLAAAGPTSARDGERMALALAAGLARDRLWASGSRMGEGKQLEPSPHLAELARLASGGLQTEPLRPWPAGGAGALTRDELCAALPDDPGLAEVEPEQTALHRDLGVQRHSRERAILEQRVDRYAGDLTAPDLADELATRLAFDEAHPLSASTLDRLAGCGFRALADVVLRLRPDEEQDESLDARHKGTVLHRCLERAFRALQEAKLLPLGGEARKAKQREVFLAAVRDELAATEERGEAGHPVVWNAERRRIERELLGVLEDGQETDDGFIPTEFETNFGEDRPAVPLEVADGRILLGGRLDRIDVGPGGRLRVVDYKSSSSTAKRLKREFAGRDLQLGHYALILDVSGRAQSAMAASVDAVYYSLREAEFSASLGEVCEDEKIALAEFLAFERVARERLRAAGTPNLPNLIEDHVSRARAGRFPVAPGDCRYCAFAAGCRVGGYHEEWE